MDKSESRSFVTYLISPTFPLPSDDVPVRPDTSISFTAWLRYAAAVYSFIKLSKLQSLSEFYSKVTPFFDPSMSLLVVNERRRVSNVRNRFTHDCFNGATTHELRNTGNDDWLFIRLFYSIASFDFLILFLIPIDFVKSCEIRFSDIMPKLRSLLGNQIRQTLLSQIVTKSIKRGTFCSYTLPDNASFSPMSSVFDHQSTKLVFVDS